MTPGWLLDAVTVLMLAVAAVSAARLAVTRTSAGSDIGHLLMAIAMAGALAPRLAVVPNVVWAIVFGLLTTWFGVQFWRDCRVRGARALGSGQCAPRLAHAVAMAYMSLTVAGRAPGSGGMSGMGGGGALPLAYPTVAFILALILIGYVIWDLDRFSAFSPVTACRVVMGLSMSFMLVIML